MINIVVNGILMLYFQYPDLLTCCHDYRFRGMS